MPSITTDKFYWWFSEDDRLWQEWTYIYSENLDILEDSSFVQLSNWSATVNDMTSSWKDPIVMIEVEWKIIIWCEDGVIFKEGVATAVYTESTWWDIVWMFINSDDLMFITYHWTYNELKYHTISLSDTSNNNWAWLVTENKISIPVTPTSALMPIRQIWNKCYIWVWANVIVISYSITTSVYTNSVFIFPNKPITWITYSWATIKVFQEDWILYIWDWAKENYQEAISLDTPIRNVIPLANIEYVVWWYSRSYTEFFYLNWYTLVPIFSKRYSERLSSHKFNITAVWWLQNYITIQKGNLFIPTVGLSKDWISVYWNWVNWLPKWLSTISTKSSFWYTYSTIFWVYARWVGLYIAYKDSGWNIWLDRITAFEHNNNLLKEWEIYSLVYNCWSSVLWKQFKELEVRAEWVTRDIKIVVKYSIDSDSYHTLWEVTTDWITYFSMDWTDKQNFRDISFKFEFDATDYPTALTENIKLYWFTMHYDFNR